MNDLTDPETKSGTVLPREEGALRGAARLIEEAIILGASVVRVLREGREIVRPEGLRRIADDAERRGRGER